MMKVRHIGAALVLGAALLAGCQSYRLVQKNVFSDEDGRLVTVVYGVAEKDHVNTFVSPMTGKEMPFRSRLVVEEEMLHWGAADTAQLWLQRMQALSFSRCGPHGDNHSAIAIIAVEE